MLFSQAFSFNHYTPLLRFSPAGSPARSHSGGHSTNKPF